jgi:hypothetical protein
VVAGYGVLLVGLALIPAFIARRKGQGFWLWFAFGLLLWIGAIIAVFFVKDKRPRCPECREVVHPEATRCPHCQSEIGGRLVEPLGARS